METILKAEIKADPVYSILLKKIVGLHKVPQHTISTLTDNKHIKDFCVESRHFMFVKLSDETTIYMHYDCSTWFKEPADALISIDAFTFYEDYLEYDTARLKQLHSVPLKDSDIPNIN